MLFSSLLGGSSKSTSSGRSVLLLIELLIWEGNISDVNCTRDLAEIKVPKIMWFSDSYPVKGYMDYFPFEVAWTKATKPDMVLMAQRSKIKDMEKEVGVPVYWMPFGGDPIWHYDNKTNEYYDISYCGTINPNKDHADQKKAALLSKLVRNGFNIRATISHSAGNRDYAFMYSLDRPTLAEYSKTICMGKIGFNCNIAGDLTMRTFEIPLMNRPLLSNGGDSYDLIFEDGKDIIIYDEDTIVEWTRTLVGNKKLREEIAKNGLEKISKSHTYEARIKQIELLVDNKIDEYEKSLYG